MLRVEDLDAILFDLDGVLTETASLHETAWKRLFDEELSRRDGAAFRPFTSEDYRRFVDGKPRYDGVASFLASREIALPFGEPSDPPDAQTVCGLGNRKNSFFRDLLAGGVTPFPSSVRVVDELRRLGVRIAVVSSSANAAEVLAGAGMSDLFDVLVDGNVAAEGSLAGKPEPDTFLAAAGLLGADPTRSVVIEDALSGVEAGRTGDFGLVVGVSRGTGPDALRAAGADVVVTDLSELEPWLGTGPSPDPRPIASVPSLSGRRDLLALWVAAREPAVFLDYDGTLTPIVDDPAAALLDDDMRRALARLAERCTVAILSGRDLADVRHLVGLPNLVYAGSHGLDIAGPGGISIQHGLDSLPALDEAEKRLGPVVASVPGALLERKRLSLSVHYRMVPDPGGVTRLDDAVREAAAAGLRVVAGKKVLDLRPDLDWDKGRALQWLLTAVQLPLPDTLPLYVGDDVTDEDAFTALRGRGVGIVVRGEDDDRPTGAALALAGPSDVAALLGDLTDLLL